MESHQHLLENPQLLLKQYLASQKEIEESNQIIYNYKRQLQTAEALSRECESEIEAISAENEAKLKQQETKFLQTQEEFSIIRDSLQERIQSLHNELQQKETDNKELWADLEVLKKNECSTQAADEEKLFEELGKTRDDNQILLENIKTLQATIADIQRSRDTQADELRQLKSDNEELNEALSLKRFELDEANELILTLQDDVMGLKTELEAFKSRPLEEQSKGNSLFAEVDDRRVQLQSTVNTMRNKYQEMRRERADHVKLIAHLRNENAVLCNRWETEIIQKANDEAIVNEADRRRIEHLEGLLANYKKDFDEKIMHFTGSSCDEMRFYDNMLKAKKIEVEEFREKIAALSLSQTLLTRELAETKRDVRKWKLEATQYKNEANKFKSELQELKNCQNKLSPEAELDNVDRRSNITTRKKSSGDTMVSLKSCLKDKSDNRHVTNGDFLQAFCSKSVQENVTSSAKSTITTVDTLLQYDLSPSYFKESNSSNECNKLESHNKDDYQPKRVNFTKDTTDNVRSNKIKSFKISTNCSVVYIDKEGKTCNKENIEQ